MNKFKLKTSSSAVFSVLSVLVALLIGAVIILFYGENPFRVYYSMIFESVSSLKNILNVFYVMTPMMMTGLAFIVASKSGMINLGLEGQLLIGALSASFVATLFPALPAVIYIPMIMLCAMVSGALWAVLPGILKLKFQASEIVTTIMLNYVMQFFVNFIVSGGVFKHESIAQRTPYILENAHLTSFSEMGTEMGTKIFRGVQLNGMFFISIAFIAFVWILLNKTKWGYKMRAVGKNSNAATSNRIFSSKVMLLSMALSGSIAGVSAMGEVLGTFNGLVEGFSPGYGFTGISVALLGREHPVGVIIGGLFFGIMNQGMMYINTGTSIPKDFVKVLQTIIIIFIVLSPYFEELWNKRKEKRAAKEVAV